MRTVARALMSLPDNPVFISFGIRGAGLVGRIALIFVTARYLTAADLGLFNLLQAAIGIFTLLGGLELVQFLMRDISRIAKTAQENATLSNPAKTLDYGPKIGSYFTLTAPLVVLATMGFAFFAWSTVKQADIAVSAVIMVALVVALFITEHYNNELQRILIGLGASVSANLVLFVRGSVWPVIALCWTVARGGTSPPEIFAIWTVFSLCATVFALIRLRALRALSRPRIPDKAWAHAAIVVTVPIFIGTVFQRMPFFADKLILSTYGLEKVGDYAILLSLALVVRMMFEASLLAFRTPWLLGQTRGCDTRAALGKLYAMSALLMLGLSGALYLARVQIFDLLDKPYLADYAIALPLLMGAIVLVGLSLIANLTLIACDATRINMICDGVYCAIFLGVLLRTTTDPVETVAAMQFAAAAVLFTAKTAIAMALIKPGKPIL